MLQRAALGESRQPSWPNGENCKQEDSSCGQESSVTSRKARVVARGQCCKQAGLTRLNQKALLYCMKARGDGGKGEGSAVGKECHVQNNPTMGVFA